MTQEKKKMKGYYSKKLQKNSKLYAELQENIQLYYQHSIEKEQKQKKITAESKVKYPVLGS